MAKSESTVTVLWYMAILLALPTLQKMASIKELVVMTQFLLMNFELVSVHLLKIFNAILKLMVIQVHVNHADLVQFVTALMQVLSVILGQ